MIIYITSPLPKVKRDRKYVKASGLLKDSVYETPQNSFAYKITTIGKAHTRAAHDKARPGPSMDREGGHAVPPLAEELLTIRGL